MGEFSGLGKLLIVLGLIIAAIGVLFFLGGKIPWLGRLPGDFCYKGKHVTFYFPLASSILASIILSILLYLFFRK
jgi:hypothetical protein